MKVLRSWLIIVFLFASLYTCISLVNHWCFRTYALDLGAYTSALYDYAHFQQSNTLAFNAVSENQLAGHFDLYLVLVSPLSWIFGTYTLLLVQIVAVLYGGLGVRKLMLPYGTKQAALAMVYFYSFFGVVAAFSYDYHSNVVAAALIPWLFLSVREQKTKSFVIYFLLVIVSRENLSLLLFVVLPCTLLVYKNLSPSFKKWIWMATAFSLVYFVVISAVVMPALSNGGKMYQFRYSVLGETYGAALKTLITHPIDSLLTLFRNHSSNPKFDGIKAEFWIYLMLSGMVLFVARWHFFIMLLPVLAQKLFHDQPEMWGINDHYSAELAPLMTIGVFYAIQQLNSVKTKNIMGYVMVVVSIGLTIHMMDNPVSLVRKPNVRIYQAEHYQPVVPPQLFNEASKLIPAHAALSCQTLLMPHFAWRDHIYTFPVVKDAEYVFLYTPGPTYPLSKKEYLQRVNELKNDITWKVMFDKDSLLLLKNLRRYNYNDF